MSELRFISPSEIEAASRALISARQTNLGIEVQMPVIYPTGQAVVVVVTVAKPGEYVVHDAGYGAMALTGAGVALTQQLRARLGDLAKHYGCDFIEGRMSRHCTLEQLALAMVLVANASRTVGDQVLEAKRKPMTKFRLETADVVAQVFGQRVRKEEAIKSEKGKVYRVDAGILDERETNPIAFVEAVTDEQAVNRRFREFYDLQRTPRFGRVRRIGIFDNRRVWPPDELSILDDVCTTIPYSDASSRLHGLAA